MSTMTFRFIVLFHIHFFQMNTQTVYWIVSVNMALKIRNCDWLKFSHILTSITKATVSLIMSHCHVLNIKISNQFERCQTGLKSKTIIVKKMSFFFIKFPFPSPLNSSLMYTLISSVSLLKSAKSNSETK